MPTNQVNSAPDGGESLKTFQLSTAGIKDKSSKEYGLAISRYINSTTSFNTGGYYFTRNARFIKNRNYANGRIDIRAMFQDRFDFNGKQNYVNLNWNALQIVNRIVSGLVGRWMKRNERIVVTAIDTLSQTQKRRQYEEIEEIILSRRELEQLEKESGVQLVPKTGIPEDEEELRLLQPQIEKLPEEILTEIGCNDVLASNGWFDVMKEKMLHDAAEVLFVGTYTWMDTDGVVHVRIVKPENAIYSFSEQNDLRDTSWRGEAPSLKISEIRRQWGKEFNPNNPNALTEEQIWQIAQKAKEYQYQANIAWNDLWYTSFLRPYDEWNVRSLQFELKTVDSEPYTVTRTKNKSTYTQKGYPTTVNGNQKIKPSVNQNIIGDTNWNIYRGVYLPDCDILLEWGLKTNMITPQDPAEIGNAEFSYSFVMPQNYMMRNLAIPEKIEAAVDGMILALLKMQQVMARLVPSGWAINETALRGVDYGLGEAGNNAVDHTRLFFQTGLLYYNGKDAEGNDVAPPIMELANSGFAAQMQGLIANYQFNYQALKDELGEDPNLISAALQPRVTAGNVEASQLQAEYATDYIYRAYAQCMAITAKKVSCLIKDSVTFGSKAYKTILNKEDVIDRVFSTKIQFLPTEFEIQKFEVMMNQLIGANPDLNMFVNPFELIRIAKEDVKLAELLMRQAQKKMLMWQRQTAMENQKTTIEGQIMSAKEAEKSKQETEGLKGNLEIEKVRTQGSEENKKTLLASIMKMYETGVQIPPELRPVATAVLQNIAIPTALQNEEMQKAAIEQMMAAQQQEQEQQMQMEQEQQMGGQQQIQQPQPEQLVA
jgi:hypothetical protein